MIKSFKNREINYSKPVLVYRNLNCKHGKVNYSIKQGNYVVAHASSLFLSNVEFKISKAGQERARRTGERNVHAFAKGYVFQGNTTFHISEMTAITYNPFKHDYFTSLKNGESVANSQFAIFEKAGVLVTNF